MDLSKLSDDELQKIADGQMPSSSAIDLNSMSDDELANIAAGKMPSIGELRRSDEITTDIMGLDTPAGQEKIEMQSRILAGARPFLDYAIPGAGQIGRESEARLIQKEYRDNKTPITLQEALAIGDRRQQSREEAFPVVSLVSKGLGLVTSGALTNPLTGVARSLGRKAVTSLGPEVAEIGAMAGIGGIENVAAGISDPDRSAAEDFLNGALLSGGVTSILKTPTLTRKAVSDANDFFVNSKRRDISKQIADLDKEAVLRTGSKVVNQKKLDSIATNLSNAQTELEILATARKQADDFINSNSDIPTRIYKLPDSINEQFNASLNNVAAVKNRRLEEIGSRLMKVDKSYERLVSSLEKFKPATAEAAAAKESALRAANNFEGGLRVQELSTEADPFLGKAATQSRIRYASAAEADLAKQQLQDLLYDRNFYKSAPREVRNAIYQFERSIRNQINGLDPTGELAAANNAYHGVKTAQREMADRVDTALFEKLSQGKTDLPQVQGALNEAFDYLESAKKLKQKGSQVKSGFDDKLDSHPLLRDEIANLRTNLRADIDSTTNNYGRYLEAKKLTSNLVNEEARLQNAISRYESRLDTLNLAGDARQIAIEKTRNKVADLYKKSRDLVAGGDLPVIGSIMRLVTARPNRVVAASARKTARSLGRKVPAAASLAARGASLQLPELINDYEKDSED